MKTTYTFDEMHFGTSTDGNRTVAEPIVKRPATLSTYHWYEFARELKNYFDSMELNKDAERFRKVVSICGLYGGYWQVQLRPTNIAKINAKNIESKFIEDIDAYIPKVESVKDE